ncbi:unnamed protein product [Heterobilharzia americana]|nr:unnamed protein product [Heterobilharzia americana]
MNPNYPPGLVGYGWGTGQNFTAATQRDQPQIGFCFDSPNPQIPEVRTPVQSPGIFGFNIDQTPPNPSSAYSFSADSSQFPLSKGKFFDNIPPVRPSAPPNIPPMSPKSNNGDSGYGLITPTAPPENTSISVTSNSKSESVNVITVTKPDPHKSNTTSNTIYNSSLNNRRDSYQDSLKDMAALMTDVELTDDVIDDMRQRFDLRK